MCNVTVQRQAIMKICHEGRAVVKSGIMSATDAERLQEKYLKATKAIQLPIGDTDGINDVLLATGTSYLCDNSHYMLTFSGLRV